MSRRIIAEGAEEYWVAGKAIPGRQKRTLDKATKRRIAKRKLKASNLTLKERIGLWFSILILLLPILWVAIFPPKPFDASLYRTVHAREEMVTESIVESSRAYLEDPRTLEQIKDYMRYKFGDNYSTACMVAYGESLRSNSINSSPVEYSVGIFQINLAGAYGHGWKVHWDKVPGETLQEKTDWLQIPKNNVDLAYRMSKGGTDFDQWVAFTNGSYLNFKENCK